MFGKRTLDLGALFAAPAGVRSVDFAQPAGAAALFAPDSVTWRVMKNPVALMVGGIAAVILELAEPRVRSGVWEHTTFRTDPAGRVRRTGYAAMVTIYAAADVARAMIAGVSRRHAAVQGATPTGAPYRADDPELLAWVQATAGFGFLEAYSRFVCPLSVEDQDRYFSEGAEAAGLYGAVDAPHSRAALEALFDAMAPKLERSEILFEFLDIMRGAALLPGPLHSVQRLALRAAVTITPAWARSILGLDATFGLMRGGETTLRMMGAAAEHVVLKDAPPAQACLRLGLTANFLYGAARGRPDNSQ